MNKFRNNLHLAFYDVETGGKKVESLEQLTSQELAALKEEVMDDISGKKKDRISERQQGNTEIWNQNIIQGYGRLVAALRDNHYFDGKNQEEQAQELSKIKEQYQDEVKKQYKKIVGKRSDKKFDNSLFDFNSPDSPANKIYTQLTGAATISTVDRQYTEGYDVDFLDVPQTNLQKVTKTKEGVPDAADEVETEVDKNNRNFLSNDLPEYLWNIRKTPGVLNAMKRLPIFSVKVDRPSEVDRDAISNFLEAANRLPVKKGKSPVMVLLEALHDNTLNTNSTIDTYAIVLQKHGMDLDGFIKKYTNEVDYKQFRKCMSEIMKVGSFYINTQRANNDVKDQHAIYLSVLKIIETSGGANKAVDRFEKYVENAKADKKTEKKEGYESGEKLGATNPELYEIAQNLGITDFASATRLSKKGDQYFQDTPVEKILANLNNDDIIDAKDTFAGGSKTGSQFLEIFNQVGKEKALSNLVERAKLLNKTLGVGLPDALLNAKTIEADVKGGHTGLILLLQNIINKPGEDLYTLLSGHSENPFEGVDLSNLDEKADKAAEAMLAKMKPEELKKLGLTLPTSESMQSGLAAALTTEYKRGIGLGSKISFDEWIKGVDMNTGFQLRDGKVLVVGIGLSYHNKFNLGKGWSTTPELSASGFIPIGMGKPELSGSVGFNNETAKERITENGIQEHLGVQGGVTLMPAGVVVLSAGFKWEQDKLAGIESAEQKKMVEFRDQIMGSILTKAFEKRKEIKNSSSTKINFNEDIKPTRVETFKEAILDVAKTEDEKGNMLVPEDKQEMVTNAVMRLLVNYNGYDISNEDVRDVIAQGIAEQYAMAWAEDRKAHITKKAYLAGANLGAFWVAGSPLVGIYAGVKFNKHDLDGYGDRGGRERGIDQIYEGVWNQEMLNKFNAQLGLSDNEKLSLNAEGFVVIPQSLIHRVNVNVKMKGLMKKDTNGNILLHNQTPMAVDIRRGSATQGSEIIIGGKIIGGNEGDGKFAKLDVLGSERFTEEIDQRAVLKLGEGIKYSEDTINSALNALKAKFPQDKKLQGYQIDDSVMGTKIGELQSWKSDKKPKLIIESENGNLTIKGPYEGTEGEGLEMEYVAKFEMIASDAKTIADAVYAEALKLKNPTVLNAVKHNKLWEKDYAPFRNAMDAGNYENAKIAIVPIFDRLDKEIKDENIKFSDILKKTEFQNLKEDALAQAMMAINNIFARSKQVRGGNGNYEFKRPKGGEKEMRAIIDERDGILDTLKSRKDIDDNAKGRYEELFKATKKYVKRPEFAQKSANAEPLGNTVGFNLGDKTKPENPLFNPEIYNPMVNLDELKDFSETARDGLHKRAMSLFAKNPALINPVLQAAGIDTQNLKLEDIINKGTMTINKETKKCELTLDINGKKYTLSTGMKFGFFTQCVNHTIILSDISVEGDGMGVTFNSGVWENGVYKEGNKSSIVATTTVGMSGSVIVNDGRKKNEESFTKPTEEDRGKIDKTDITGAEEVTDQSAKDGDEGEGIISLKW